MRAPRLAITVQNKGLWALLTLAIFLNAVLWSATYKVQPRWPNVPPPPSATASKGMGFGDTQMAYRTLAFRLQQMGNEGGRYAPLYQYNYNRLGSWFHVLHELDSTSNYVPYLAAYYFGGTQKPTEQLRPVIDYLATAGRMERDGKWRWLSQAVYLAHYRYKDKPLALELAAELAALPAQMPYWARQMPAILNAAAGEKETALALTRALLTATLAEKGEKADGMEIGFMIDFICDRLQTPAEAAKDPLCQK